MHLILYLNLGLLSQHTKFVILIYFDDILSFKSEII